MGGFGLFVFVAFKNAAHKKPVISAAVQLAGISSELIGSPHDLRTFQRDESVKVVNQGENSAIYINNEFSSIVGYSFGGTAPPGRPRGVKQHLSLFLVIESPGRANASGKFRIIIRPDFPEKK